MKNHGRICHFRHKHPSFWAYPWFIPQYGKSWSYLLFQTNIPVISGMSTTYVMQHGKSWAYPLFQIPSFWAFPLFAPCIRIYLNILILISLEITFGMYVPVLCASLALISFVFCIHKCHRCSPHSPQNSPGHYHYQGYSFLYFPFMTSRIWA